MAKLLQLDIDSRNKNKLLVGPFSDKVVNMLQSLPDEWALLLHHIHHHTISKGQCAFNTVTMRMFVGKKNLTDFRQKLTISQFIDYKKVGRSHKYYTKQSVRGGFFHSINFKVYNEINTKLMNFETRYVKVGSFRIDPTKANGKNIKPYQITNFNNGKDYMKMNDCGKWFQITGTFINKDALYNIEDNMVELDIISCQASLMADVIGYDTFNPEEIYKLTLEDNRKAQNKKSISYTNHLKDCVKWKNMVKAVGDVYSFIQHDINIYNELQYITREEVKTQFNMFLCDFNYQSTNNLVLKWIKAFVPSLFENICDYKMFESRSLQGFKFHNKMFKLVCDLFSWSTAKAQRENNYNLSFVFRNDALIVCEKDADTWYNVLNQCLDKFNLPSCISVNKLSHMDTLPPVGRSAPSLLDDNDNDNDNDVRRNDERALAPEQDNNSQDTVSLPYKGGKDNDTKTNDTKILGFKIGPREIKIDQIQEINNNGSKAWYYRGTGKQQIKKSCKKMSKERFMKEVNDKFKTGEWK